MRRAVIFDLDGVLVASAAAHQASWQALARRHGLSLTPQAFADTFGRTSRDVIRQLWGADLPEDRVRALDDEKEAIYRELIRGMVPLTIGARETLAALKQAGLALALCTSGPPENLELVLRETRLASFFDATVHGREIERGKPAPDGFLLAARRLDVQPAACAVVEDAPAGIQGAVAAGMRAIGYASLHPPQRLREAGAVCVVDQLTAITPELVGQLLGR